MAFSIGAPVRLVVRAATHVNPKATKHHTKSRPKKVRAEYPATSSLSHWDSIQRAALNPETDARRQARAGFVDGTRICAFHARIIRCSRTAAYRVASRLSEPRVRPNKPAE